MYVINQDNINMITKFCVCHRLNESNVPIENSRPDSKFFNLTPNVPGDMITKMSVTQPDNIEYISVYIGKEKVFTFQPNENKCEFACPIYKTYFDKLEIIILLKEKSNYLPLPVLKIESTTISPKNNKFIQNEINLQEMKFTMPMKR